MMGFIMLVKKIIVPFLLALFAMSVFLLWASSQGGGIPAFSSNVPLNIGIKLLLFNLSWVLALSAPFAVLFASMYVQRTSERPIKAVTAAFKPSILFALVLAALFFFHNSYILPNANHLAKVYVIAIRSGRLDRLSMNPDYLAGRGDREMTLSQFIREIEQLDARIASLKIRQDGRSKLDVATLRRVEREELFEMQKGPMLSASIIVMSLLGILIGSVIRHSIPTKIVFSLVLFGIFWIVFAYSSNLSDRLAETSSLSVACVWLPILVVTIVTIPLFFWLGHRIAVSNARMEKMPPSTNA